MFQIDISARQEELNKNFQTKNDKSKKILDKIRKTFYM